tara:strand:+ start:2769 stop:4085 length:1317 start_codon:yes stop_codon:yes gene_type:complete
MSINFLMQKGFKTKILLLLLIAFSFYGFFLFKSLDVRHALLSYLTWPNSSFLKDNKISNIEVLVDEDTQKHFEALFRHYKYDGNGDKNIVFRKYYSEHNVWKKAKLKIDGKVYSGKIKSHGKTPYAHKYGQHFSFTFKFKKKSNPYGKKRLNFLVYSRFQLNIEFIKSIAKVLRLPMPNFELAQVCIPGNVPYLYFVEERIDKHYFKRINKNFIVFNKSEISSLIYHGENNLKKLEASMNKELFDDKWSGLSDSLKSKIKFDFNRFNRCLALNQHDSLIKFINEEYCLRVNAFRILYSDDGHAFNSDNFEMAYDTIEGLFYPLLHKDHVGYLISDMREMFHFLNRGRNEVLPFFAVLNNSDSIKTESIRLALNALKCYNTDSVIKNIHYKYKGAFLFDHFYNSNGNDGLWLIKHHNNLKHSSEKILLVDTVENKYHLN